MEHLDAATLDEFIAYNKKFYVPNNAVLVVAGNFEIDDVKKKISDYFGPIPRGEEVPRINITEDPITAEIKKKFYDPNLLILLLISYLFLIVHHEYFFYQSKRLVPSHLQLDLSQYKE